MPRGAWIVILAILLAGCTQDTAPTVAPEREPSTLGAISGVTLSPDIQPLSDVALELVPSMSTAESDLFGRFRFEAIPPGTYTIVASAPEYDTTNLTVVVQAGETLRPRVIMDPIPVPVPRHDTLDFDGYFQASQGPATGPAGVVTTTAGLANCTCVFQMPAPSRLVAITIEAVWEDSVSGPEATQYRWNLSIDQNRSIAGAAPSPMLVHLTPEEIPLAGGRSLEIMIQPDEDWPSYDQKFELFVTLWEVEAPEDGWSYIQGQ